MLLSIHNTFFPKKIENYQFDQAIAAIDQQQIARISKIALYVLAVIGTTATVLAIEASLFVLPIAIPIMIVTAIAWGIFFRLHTLDERYVEGLDDNLRSNLAKEELTKILCTAPAEKSDETALGNTLGNINKLLGQMVYSTEQIKTICELNAKRPVDQSIAAMAQVEGISIAIDHKLESLDIGRFGNPSYKRTLEVHWKGTTDDAIAISLKTEIK
jgi:hypothetical protein